MSGNHLVPPRPIYVNPDHIIPLSPPPRPPFRTCASASTLPPTPHTPYSTAPSPTVDRRPMSASGASTPLRPFLSLGPRILLTALSPALLPLILTIAHLIQTQQSTSQLATQLKSSLLSACSGLAKGAASIQTLPRYLAMQTNDEVVRATQASVLAIGEALMDLVTIIEVVVTFIVNCYRSVLLCTLQLAVQGTLDILIDAVELITNSVTGTLNTIRTEIQDAISSGNAVIQEAVSAINKVTSLVDVNLSVPNITVPQLAFLENVTIPTTFEDTLLKLNASMPTLSELKSKMDEIIDTPFELLIAEINSTRLEMAANFNSSILPVPSLSSLATTDTSTLENELCGNLDTGLIDDTASALHTLGSVAIGLMFLVLFLVWAALAVWEWRKWRALHGTVEIVQREWKDEGEHDPWRVVAIVEHPMLEKYGAPVINRFSRTPRARTNLRWYLSYLSHPTCLTLLFISAIGFIALEFQLAALDAIKHHIDSTANSTVTASTDSLVARLNSLSANSSAQYASEFNTAVGNIQDRINDELFGSWVNTTAVTLNSTLVEFYAEVESLLNATFGGTILYDPVNTFIYCLIGAKITNLENGLTWLSNHSQIALPTLPSDILQLSNSSMNELVAPITAAAVGSSTGGNGSSNGVVNDLITHFESALKVERTVYAVLLALWLGLALIGLAIVFWHSGGRERFVTWREGRRGLRNGKDQAIDFAPPRRQWPWTRTSAAGPTPIYDAHAEKYPNGVPTIIEPTENLTSSFFDYRRASAAPSRGGQTFSFLAAPGQAFLRMTGYNSSPPSLHDRSTTATPLVRPGTSSEKYNRAADESAINGDAERHGDRDLAPTPPPFWVNKFSGAVDGFRGLVSRNLSRQNSDDTVPGPSRMRGGALGGGMGLGVGGLRRNASVKTEQSFGASRGPTARTPGQDWLDHSQAELLDTYDTSQEYEPTAPVSFGFGNAQEGRYPQFHRPGFGERIGGGNDQTTRVETSRAGEVYPRRMSRAPTIGDGAYEIPPQLPAKDYLSDENIFDDDNHHTDETFPEPRSFSSHVDSSRPSWEEARDTDIFRDYQHDHDHAAGDGIEMVASPSSSSAGSVVWSEPRVESAHRGTAALASILATLQAQRGAGGGREERREDPFSTPFDDDSENTRVRRL